MKHLHWVLVPVLLIGVQAMSGVHGPPDRGERLPAPAIEAWHTFDDVRLAQATAVPQPVVHAVLFWMDGCPHCHQVLENVLPPLHEKYAEQFELLLLEVVSADDVDRLFEVAAAYGISKEKVGVPFLVLGDHVLIGSAQIPAELPGLIDEYLAQGGVGWPGIPGLEPDLSAAPPAGPSSAASDGQVVQAVLFSTADCHECQLIAGQALAPLEEQYGEGLQIQVIDIVTSQDVGYLYRVAAGYGLSEEQVDLPLLIIGDHVLIAEQITRDLAGLVEGYRSAGGIDSPVLPSRDVGAAPDPGADTQPSARPLPDGFGLAVGVLVGMVAALAYTGVTWLSVPEARAAREEPEWLRPGIPLLALAGAGVAGYLSYVETQAVAAVCGPIGDCNAVQSSSYAHLFGVLPVGVLGVTGYVAILVLWAWGRWGRGRPAAQAPRIIFAMSVVGVLFSLYLTYLEPFVIGAVCAWCLGSAVLMTFIMLLSQPLALTPARNTRRRQASSGPKGGKTK